MCTYMVGMMVDAPSTVIVFMSMRRRLYPRDAESRVSDCSVLILCAIQLHFRVQSLFELTITFQMITFGVWQWPVRSGPQVSFGDLPTFYANFQRQRGRVQLWIPSTSRNWVLRCAGTPRTMYEVLCTKQTHGSF